MHWRKLGFRSVFWNSERSGYPFNAKPLFYKVIQPGYNGQSQWLSSIIREAEEIWLEKKLRSSPNHHAHTRCVKRAGGLPQSSMSGLWRTVCLPRSTSRPLLQVWNARHGPPSFKVQQQTMQVCLQIRGSSSLHSGNSGDSMRSVQLGLHYLPSLSIDF